MNEHLFVFVKSTYIIFVLVAYGSSIINYIYLFAIGELVIYLQFWIKWPTLLMYAFCTVILLKKKI